MPALSLPVGCRTRGFSLPANHSNPKKEEEVMLTKKNGLALLALLAVVALIVSACAPEPQVIEKEVTVVETVEVEKEVTVVETVEVETEVTVVETVEVEKEVTVIETVVVEAEAPEQISFAGHQYFNLSFGAAPAPLEDMKARATEAYPGMDVQLIMQPLYEGYSWRITYSAFACYHPSWSPDGGYIAFVSQSGGHWSVTAGDGAASAIRAQGIVNDVIY